MVDPVMLVVCHVCGARLNASTFYQHWERCKQKRGKARNGVVARPP